tara:strand:+ start:532 stop:1104 length:573 start_codon:yes stop_codon:yes gene_type:complete
LPTTKLRRGFVKEANEWAIDLRQELNLLPQEPMCPWRLSKHLRVRIIPLSALRQCPERTLLFQRRKGCGFSAAVCFDGIEAFIVINDINDPKRQVSDIAHELAHVLLRHPPSNPFHADGIREFSAEHELEAERLGPTLLVSGHAALEAYRSISSGAHTLSSLSDTWNITEDVIRMQINLSGAKKRFRNAA